MRRKPSRFNVYDEGSLILENVTSNQVVKIIGVPSAHYVYNYAEHNCKFKNRYTIEKLHCWLDDVPKGELPFALEYGQDIYSQIKEMNRRYGNIGK